MKKLMLTLFFAVFLLSAMAVPTLSQTDVGVEVGDHFKWEGTYTHITTQDGSQVPGQVSLYAVWNDTDYVNRTVASISGTNVTFDTVWVYKNGSQETSTAEIPIFNSSAGNTLENYVVVGAEMEVGDVFTENDYYANTANPQLTMNISETVQIDYGAGPRDTNYHFTTTIAWATVGRQYWFDKATGILTKAIINATRVDTTWNSTTTYTIELVDTNRWIIPEFPTGTVMLLAFAAVAVSVEIIRRKKLKK